MAVVQFQYEGVNGHNCQQVARHRTNGLRMDDSADKQFSRVFAINVMYWFVLLLILCHFFELCG
jgi:hypothetical protein